MGGKRWTQEEIEYLVENWGRYNPNTIALKLNRSKYSVINKASKMNLGSSITASGNYLSLSDIEYILNIQKSVIRDWIKSGILKAEIFTNKKVFRISIKSFIEFLKNNQDKWNTYKVNLLLIQGYLSNDAKFFKLPKWFLEKCKKDRERYFLMREKEYKEVLNAFKHREKEIV